MYKKDRRVIDEKNRQLEIIKDIHKGKIIMALIIIHYQAFVICFNPILSEWKQNPDFLKGEAKFLPTQNSHLTLFLGDFSPIS